jgi:TRAP-type C4-dicarboxylate transport system permease large subunit
MQLEFIILIVMLGTFAGSVFWWKMPAGVALVLASIAGALVGGYGVPVRHLVEGTFGYLDAVLIISTAMLFMKVIESTGALSTISYGLIRAFYRWPTVLMIVIVFFVMFPGMLTGLSSACILTTGALVTPALIAMGIPPVAVGVFIAVAAVFGMIAPPINIPVMIIGGGVDMPFIGFDVPLMVATFPPAILTALYYRFRYVRRIDVDAVLAKLPKPVYKRHGVKLFLPIVIVVGLMVAIRVVPQLVPDIGMPLIFLLGAVTGFGTGERWDVRKVSSEAVRAALPVMAILVGVGAFVQIMTLTGVRGMIAVSALQLPPSLLYAGIALMMPAFGSAYAASSVLGVPLVYVFLGKNEIIVTSALSLIAGMGDLMPPPALLCVFAAQLVGEKNHFRILRLSLPLVAISVLWGILMIIFAEDLAAMLPRGF